MNVLITGVAGFIGFNLAKSLLKNSKVVGVDNINSYYSQKLKKDRINNLKVKILSFINLILLKQKNLLQLLKRIK